MQETRYEDMTSVLALITDTEVTKIVTNFMA